MSNLDADLRAAHTAGDLAALVGLYTAAADCSIDEGASEFYLTHAYVFALETDHPQVLILRQKLVEQGCEAPLPAYRPAFR